MELTFYGDPQNNRITTILVDSLVTRISLDCGMIPGRPQQPIIPNYIIKTIDAIFLTHAHLDHWGYLPWLINNGYKNKVYMTKPTFELYYHYGRKEYFNRIAQNNEEKQLYKKIFKILGKLIVIVEFGQIINYKDFKIIFLPANHILGASQILIQEKDTKNQILYTGDFNPNECPLFEYLSIESLEKEYSVKIRPIVVIFDCSNIHLKKKEIEDEIKHFIQEVNETYENLGDVLIPCKALGEAQEVLVRYITYFKERDLKNPIYFFIKGSLIDVNKVYINNKDQFKNPSLLDLLSNTMVIQNFDFYIEDTTNGYEDIYFNDEGLYGFKLFITTGSHVEFGSSRIIFNYIKSNPQNLIVLPNRGKEPKCKTKILKTNIFSLHGDYESKLEYSLDLCSDNDPMFFLIHSSRKNLEFMQNKLKSLNIKCNIPKIDKNYPIGDEE